MSVLWVAIFEIISPSLMRFLLLILAPFSACALPLEILNQSLEINGGIDETPLSDASVLGWTGDAILSDGDADYGNGRWKVLLNDSSSATYLTGHQIETGSAYSIRFDAALNPNTTFIPPNAIIGGALLNGDFNADSSETSSRSFSDTPHWTNLTGNQALQATTLSGTLPAPDNSRNALVTDSSDQILAIDTNYTLTEGQKLELSFQWRDGLGWNDSADQIRAILFTTSDNTMEFDNYQPNYNKNLFPFTKSPNLTVEEWDKPPTPGKLDLPLADQLPGPTTRYSSGEGHSSSSSDSDA